jgi:hypothetical protein
MLYIADFLVETLGRNMAILVAIAVPIIVFGILTLKSRRQESDTDS